MNYAWSLSSEQQKQAFLGAAAAVTNVPKTVLIFWWKNKQTNNWAVCIACILQLIVLTGYKKYGYGNPVIQTGNYELNMFIQYNALEFFLFV